MNKIESKKIWVVIGFFILIAVIIVFIYPIGSQIMKEIRTHSYMYGYTPTKFIRVKDTSNMPPAQSVPILMYHGVIISNNLGDNTERKNFIEQMEMLKENGYQTISIEDYDLFRQGKFILPPKPVILTFDDGRKDSYFTVDSILKKLNFKATIFIATHSTGTDPFFLTWDELKTMQKSGRWDIQAHGQKSHLKILIDANNDTGNYLASRIYSPVTGLESISDYEKRLKYEYIDGKLDLLYNLKIDAKYFAIPLNSYGTGSLNLSNYDGAFAYNDKLTKENFKLSFLQAEMSGQKPIETFYNYKDTNPYKLLRLEVKDMSADKLLADLELFAPKSINFTLPPYVDDNYLSRNVNLLYGEIRSGSGLTLSSSLILPSARLTMGDLGWQNYKVKTEINRIKGKSTSILIYYLNEYNYLSLDYAENSLILTERKDGVDKILYSKYPLNLPQTIKIEIGVKNGLIYIDFDGLIIDNHMTTLTRGAIAFSVWDPNGAEATINKLEIIGN